MNMKFSITAQAAAALLIAICFFIGLASTPLAPQNLLQLQTNKPPRIRKKKTKYSHTRPARRHETEQKVRGVVVVVVEIQSKRVQFYQNILYINIS